MWNWKIKTKYTLNKIKTNSNFETSEKQQEQKENTSGERKKLERENWKAAGGTFKEIKLTESGSKILAKGRDKENFKKWPVMTR